MKNLLSPTFENSLLVSRLQSKTQNKRTVHILISTLTLPDIKPIVVKVYVVDIEVHAFTSAIKLLKSKAVEAFIIELADAGAEFEVDALKETLNSMI